MARFDGVIGFVKTVETRPGYYEEEVTEYHRRGTLLKHAWNSTDMTGTNEDFKLSNRVAIVASKEMIANSQYARYIVMHGAKWEIANLELDTERPEMTITLGGLYHGK